MKHTNVKQTVYYHTATTVSTKDTVTKKARHYFIVLCRCVVPLDHSNVIN